MAPTTVAKGAGADVLLRVAGVERNPLDGLCEVAAFGEDAVGGYGAIHGAFSYDVRAGGATPWFFGKQGPQKYNLLTTSPMSVVMAGNTTVAVRTAKCPRAGCPTPPQPRGDGGERCLHLQEAHGCVDRGARDLAPLQ